MILLILNQVILISSNNKIKTNRISFKAKMPNNNNITNIIRYKSIKLSFAKIGLLMGIVDTSKSVSLLMVRINNLKNKMFLHNIRKITVLIIIHRNTVVMV
jgi:hypothetical protein